MGSMHELIAQARHRINVADFHRMAETGILLDSDRVELIEGEILDMAPIGSKHAFVVNRLTRFFTLAAGEQYLVSTQNPVRLSELSELQPDIALLRSDDYMDRLPGPADVLLLIEVAHSSVEFDRGVKMGLYARHSIPEVWLLDLNGGELAMYRDPSEGQYRHRITPLAGEPVSPLLLPQIVWQLEIGKTWSVPY